MSKTKRRKKSKARASTGSPMERERVERVLPAGPARLVRPVSRPSMQNAVFALMVMLGCVGLAIFFIFFYREDANHFLYGGVMGLTALGWLIIATRRWSTYRQRVRA